jgi:PAS domain S-box-containing protein
VQSEQRPAFRLSTAARAGVVIVCSGAAIAALRLAPDFLSATPFLPSGFASLLVLVVAGVLPALATQMITLLATSWFLLPPVGSFTMSHPADLGRFALFLGFYGLVDLIALRLERIRATSAERKRALLESQNRYRFLLEQASDGIVLVHPDGHFLMINQRTCELLGYEHEELMQLPLTGIFAPGELDRVPLAWDDIKRMPIVLRERRMQRKDGTSFDAEISIRRTQDGSAQAIIRDITERRRAEEALRKERDLLDGILTTSVAGILVVDPEGRPLFLNAQAERVLGVTREMVDGRTDLPPGWRFTTLDGAPLPDDERPTFRVVTTGEPVQGARLALERPDGRRLVLTINAAPLRDGERRITAVVLSVADITEQAGALDAVRESEEKLQRVTEAVPGVVYQYEAGPGDADRFTFVSDRALEFLGVSPEDVLADASRAWGRVHPGDRLAMHEAFQRNMVTLAPWSFDFRVTGPEGRVQWLRDIATALPGREPGQSIWSGVILDVTERKRLEEELLQSQKMDSLGRLAGGVAHDFNNVLTVIRGYADVLMHEFSDADPRQGEVKEIRRAADRATALTRQLLAVSRRQVLVTRPVDLNLLVAEMERMLRRVIGEDISIITQAADDTGWVRADTGQLEQVMLNLAVNARDAMPRGGTLTIETRRIVVREPSRDHPRARRVPPGDWAMLRMSDTGSGMDAATLSKVFEPFFTTKPVGEGTGLGLSTVYGIVQQSNGHITVDSAPGAGTTFRVFLPRFAKSEEPEVDVPRRRAMPPKQGRRATVLLVEDDDSVRQLTQRVLDEFGYDVIEARSGIEALARINDENTPIDAVVTDVVMPGMSGREMAERLRSTRPRLPVLFLSGYTGDEVMLGEDAPNQSFLQKPYSPDSLAAALDELLADSRPATRE